MGKGIIHSDTTKIRCAYLYAASGNYSKVARDTKIARKTIHTWAKDSSVWEEALLKARQEISDELLAQNLAIATAANLQVMDRIDNGDHKVVRDKIIRVPMTGKDLAVVSGIKEDKGRVSMGMVTSIRGDSDSVKSLAAQFAKLSQDHKNIQNTVVSEQKGPIDEGG